MKNKKLYLLYFLFVIFLSPLIVKGGVGGGFSKGDIYFNKLQTWYSLAAANEWTKADELDKQLDPADTVVYKSTHRPEELKKYINTLTLKKDKTVEDWLELARVQSVLGKVDDAYQSITTAKKLDPIRDDIGQIFYQTSRYK